MAINELNVSNRFSRSKNNMSMPSKEHFLKSNIKHTVNYHDEMNSTQLNNNIEPLYSGKNMSPSFKGGFLGYKQAEISEPLRKYAIELTERLGPQYSEKYNEYINSFLNKVKTDEKFRKSLHINDESLKKIEAGEWIGIPEKGIANRFLDEFSSPFKKLMGIKPSDEDAKIIKNFSQVQEFLDGITNRDIAFRKKFGITDETDEILIHIDTILEKINRKRSKDIKHEYYSYRAGQQANRLTSGIVGALFLGVDAFNITMNLTKEKYESQKEGVTRFMQEMGRLAITVYVTDLIIKTFKKESQRSMKWAIATAGAGVLVAEVAGRWLVGKPILPSSKEKIERLDQKAKNRTGISAFVGNLLSGEFLIKDKKNTPAKINSSNKQDKNIAFSSLNKTNSLNQVSFTGKYKQLITGSEKVTLYNDPKHLSSVISIFEKVDDEYATWMKKNIISCLKKHEIFERKDIKENLAKKGINVENAKSSDMIKHFDDIMQAFGNKQVPLGKKEHPAHKWIKSVFAPVFWIYKTITGISNGLKKIFGKKQSTQEKIKKLEDQLENQGLLNTFNKMMTHERTINIKRSKLKPDEIRLKMLEEYLDIKGGKLDDNIKGIYNSISWLEDTLANLKVKNKVGNHIKEYTANYKVEDFLKLLNQEKHTEKVQNEIDALKDGLFNSFKKIDGTPERGYNKSDCDILSYPVTKGLSSAFIISDIYNLSMLHSDGDKDVSIKNAKDRTFQELSRILWTQYIMGITQGGILQEFYDKSLKGAISTVALNGFTRETLSRKVVNVPITPKSYEELQENRRKSQENQGPIMKAMAKIMGKKTNIYSTPLNETDSIIPSQNQADLGYAVNFENNEFYKKYMNKTNE